MRCGVYMDDKRGSENNICIERRTCRICGSSEFEPGISLGEQYIASIFVKDDFVAGKDLDLSTGCGEMFRKR